MPLDLGLRDEGFVATVSVDFLTFPTAFFSYWTCKDLALLLCTVMMYDGQGESPFARYLGLQAFKLMRKDAKSKLAESTEGRPPGSVINQ
jgi:hypothetical protein